MSLHLLRCGCIAIPVDLRSVPVPLLGSYDAVIVGASLRGGKYQKEVPWSHRDVPYHPGGPTHVSSPRLLLPRRPYC
jgi:hypothetical protein